MYYYTQPGFAADKVIGPISANELAQLYFKKELGTKTAIQIMGSSEWIELADAAEVLDIYNRAVAHRNATREEEQRKSNALQAVKLEQEQIQAQIDREHQDEDNQIQAQRLAYEQQQAAANNLARKTAFRSALQHAGTSEKHFKLVWVSETNGKQPLYSRVETVLQEYGARGWNFEHMHETVWTRQKTQQSPTCECLKGTQCAPPKTVVTITENVMVLVFSVPAELAESFADVI
jgi:L-amino acid N-acyltransferase YncA